MDASGLRLISDRPILQVADRVYFGRVESSSAPTSDRPIARTYPAFTRSAIRSNRFFDGHGRIQAAGPVDVDVIDPEPQASREFLTQPVSVPIDQPPSGAPHARDPCKSREQRLIAAIA